MLINQQPCFCEPNKEHTQFMRNHFMRDFSKIFNNVSPHSKTKIKLNTKAFHFSEIPFSSHFLKQQKCLNYAIFCALATLWK